MGATGPRRERATIRSSRPQVQETITRIWGQVLRLDDVAPDDNFFEMGGHSMAASQVSSRIRDALDIDVSLAVFFERPTIAELTSYVVDASASAPGTTA